MPLLPSDLDGLYGRRCHPHVEQEVYEQLLEAGRGRMRMVGHGRGFQHWEEVQGEPSALNALQKRQRAAVDGDLPAAKRPREGGGEFWQSQNASLRLAELARPILPTVKDAEASALMQKRQRAAVDGDLPAASEGREEELASEPSAPILAATVRTLTVYFLRDGGVHEWKEKWTKRTTEEVSKAMGLSFASGAADAERIYLFIVVGGSIRHHGEGNIYVSGPVLRLPPVCSLEEVQKRRLSMANLLEEFHTLRRGGLVPVGVQDSSGGWSLRAAGGSNPWEGARQPD